MPFQPPADYTIQVGPSVNQSFQFQISLHCQQHSFFYHGFPISGLLTLIHLLIGWIEKEMLEVWKREQNTKLSSQLAYSANDPEQQQRHDLGVHLKLRFSCSIPEL